ncbi:MAG: hypothetical protein KC572_15675 [Gammaproteobacteria bacterium]|nr:hypothetical protein [Gammaproteobacteria bacterium]
MGMFDKLFGGTQDYPPLPVDNEAMAKIDEVKAELEELAAKVNDHLEVVPADHEAYVYLGRPPKRFGIAWIHDGKLSGLKELVDDSHLSQAEAQKLIRALGTAYEHASDAPRYSAELAGKKVVVIPSRGLGEEVQEILEGAIH